MLQHIRITNFALIKDLELDFQDGFTVITGETGSGKSIFLGALNLLLGERADFALIGPHGKKSIVEAQFHFQEGFLKSWFAQEELDYQPVCIIRREINDQGRSRAFVNDSPVTLQVLKELSEQLLFIHSQHFTHSLKNSEFQRELLDVLIGAERALGEYQSAYHDFRQVQDQLRKLKTQLANAQTDRDYIEFQLSELLELKLSTTNFAALEQELSQQEHAEAIREAIGGLINSNDSGSINGLKEIYGAIHKRSSIHPFLEEASGRLKSVLLELEDLSEEAAKQLDKLDIDPESLAKLAGQMDAYNRMLVKHRKTDQAELLELQEMWSNQLASSDHGSIEVDRLEKELDEKKKLAQERGKALMASRVKNAPAISKKIVAGLAELKMPDTKLEFKIDASEDMHEMGIDEIEVHFSPNPGLPLQPIGKTASGGELSRLMICLQQLVSEKKSLPTVLFDEIDTGVSGEVALKMGQMMRKMGETMQLLAITHLPQVAGLGQGHFKVFKTKEKDLTETHIQSLDQEARIAEIAGLMSGDNINEAAIANAKNLMG